MGSFGIIKSRFLKLARGAHCGRFFIICCKRMKLGIKCILLLALQHHHYNAHSVWKWPKISSNRLWSISKQRKGRQRQFRGARKWLSMAEKWGCRQQKVHLNYQCHRLYGDTIWSRKEASQARLVSMSYCCNLGLVQRVKGCTFLSGLEARASSLFC